MGTRIIPSPAWPNLPPAEPAVGEVGSPGVFGLHLPSAAAKVQVKNDGKYCWKTSGASNGQGWGLMSQDSLSQTSVTSPVTRLGVLSQKTLT